MEVNGQLHVPAALPPAEWDPDSHWIGDYIGSHEEIWGCGGMFHIFLTSALDGGQW
jgi:hypothetical protein